MSHKPKTKKKRRDKPTEKKVDDPWGHLICLASGCKNKGRYDGWCGPECQLWYCSRECFDKDADDHCRLCRRITGLQNVELAECDWIPDERNPWTGSTYKHKCVKAKRLIYRGEVFLNEVPLVVHNALLPDPTNYGHPLLNDLAKAARHDPSVVRADDAYRWAYLDAHEDKNGFDPAAEYVCKVLLKGDQERINKFVRSRYFGHRVSRFKEQILDRIKDENVRRVSQVMSMSGMSNTDLIVDRDRSDLYSSYGLVWMNHSCAPNAYFGYAADNFYFAALRDIHEGEEITVSYMNVLQTGNPSDRRRLVYNSLGFHCLCGACQGSGYAPSTINGLDLLIADVLDEEKLEEIECNLNFVRRYLDRRIVEVTSTLQIANGLVRTLNTLESPGGQLSRVVDDVVYHDLRTALMTVANFACDAAQQTQAINKAYDDVVLTKCLSDATNTQTLIQKSKMIVGKDTATTSVYKRNLTRSIDRYSLFLKAKSVAAAADKVIDGILRYSLERGALPFGWLEDRERATQMVEEAFAIGARYDEARPCRSMIGKSKNLKQTLTASPLETITLCVLKLRTQWDLKPNETDREFATRNLALLKKLRTAVSEIAPPGFAVSQWFARYYGQSPINKTLWASFRFIEAGSIK